VYCVISVYVRCPVVCCIFVYVQVGCVILILDLLFSIFVVLVVGSVAVVFSPLFPDL